MTRGQPTMVKAEDKIADVITKYPYIKEKLLDRNKKFRALDNPAVFNTVGRYARITDVAKVSGEDLEELLTFINGLIIGDRT